MLISIGVVEDCTVQDGKANRIMYDIIVSTNSSGIMFTQILEIISCLVLYFTKLEKIKKSRFGIS